MRLTRWRIQVNAHTSTKAATIVSTIVPPVGRLNAHEKYSPAVEHSTPKTGENSHHSA